MQQQIALFWFRRDLRTEDNAGLYHALRSGYPVLSVFIFDTNILEDLEDRYDRRVCFIRDALKNIQQALEARGSTLHVVHDTPLNAFEAWCREYHIAAVYANRDYEPYAKQRDESITAFLQERNIPLHTYKDQVIFERSEVMKDNEAPYTVYTPYSKKWKQQLTAFYLKPYPVDKYLGNLWRHAPKRIPSLEAIGFKATGYETVPPVLDKKIAAHYDKTRNYPGINGVTQLSVHLRFGTVSIRRLAAAAKQLNETLLNELIWREFFMMILWHFPHTVTQAFKPRYDDIRWRYNEEDFLAWCEGRTGYPMVDAGMRQLNETGWMHNRVRMVTASFLCKHLLIDWRRGEAYFAKKLLDYDLAQNVGNWQWVAGSGVDAAPYFRIFNPQTQLEKFDPDHQYIDKWVPEWRTMHYVRPIIDHDQARARCLEVYKAALK